MAIMNAPRWRAPRSVIATLRPSPRGGCTLYPGVLGDRQRDLRVLDCGAGSRSVAGHSRLSPAGAPDL